MNKIITLLFITISFSTLSQSSWHKTYSPDGKCSIYFPSTPTAIPNPQTGTKIYTYIGNNSIFMFTADIFTQKVKDQSNTDVYDASLKKSFYDGFFGTYNGKFISDENIIYKGKKAVNFYLSINIPGSSLQYVKGRFLIENGILYISVYFYSVFDNSDFNRFVNSLDL